MEVWIAIDTKTNRLVGFGDRSMADRAANEHKLLSGNVRTLHTLKKGMTIIELGVRAWKEEVKALSIWPIL